MEIKPLTSYYAHHNPSGEDWLLLGINEAKNNVCVAGWPPTWARLSDCVNIVEAHTLTEEELQYRKEKFGSDWN